MSSVLLRLLVLSFLLLVSEADSAIDPACRYALTHNDTNHHLSSYLGFISGKFPGAHKDKTYLYNIGVCVSPDPALPGCGIVQYDTNKSTSHCIGKIASSQVSETDDKVWVELTYTNGDSYTSHCGKESRRGRLAFLCDSLISGLGSFDFLEESNSNDMCYYLFALASRQVCGYQLGAGDIILILIACLALLWIAAMVVGFLYKRFLMGAKGWDQFPGLKYFQEFGNLEADGCDLVCRSRPRTSSTKHNTGPVFETEDEETDEEKDDNLLPM